MTNRVCLITTILLFVVLASATAAYSGGLTFEERVRAQEAIEQVYWSHRVWPAENPAPRPALEQVLRPAELRAKVERYLKLSDALEKVWGRPVTADQLQAEMNRMASGTRSPQVLRELFAALGNDPRLIAETLARQTMVERLAREWYAADSRFHGSVRATAQSALARLATNARLDELGANYRVVRWKLETEPMDRASQAGPSLDETGKTQIRLGKEEWALQVNRIASRFDRVRHVHTAEAPQQPVSTLDERFASLPVGVRTALTEEDDRFEVMTILGRGDGELTAAVVSWPKRSFAEWWSANEPESWRDVATSQQTYFLPKVASVPAVAETWLEMWYSPSGRTAHTAIWTGTEMIVWGGLDGLGLNTGGRYNPATDSWTATSTGAGVPSARARHTSVWTGTEMIVWGGSYSSDLNTGGRYNPATDTWTTTSIGAGVPAARTQHSAVWTGTEMIVWGGGGNFSSLNTGGRYNPSTDSWTATSTAIGVPAARASHSAIWTGAEMIVWGGASGTYLNTGGRYNPTTDSWTPTSTVAGVPSARWFHRAVWTGTEMIVWGGDGNFSSFNTGGRYNPSTNSWTATSTGTAVPSARAYHSAIWTGAEMIVWGGYDGAFLNTGGRYNPATNSWTATSTAAGAPPVRWYHTAVWTGTEMIVWGGYGGAYLTSGGRYSPATDSWTATSTGLGAPTPRARHTSVWTGTEMIVWGGTNGSNLNTGGRYNPATDNWTPTSTVAGVPAARAFHNAIWTGTEMVVWGGYGGAYLDTGGRYDPMTDGWTATATSAGVPSGRIRHTAVWTGTEMVVWGGNNGSDFNTGGRYNPSTNSWTATSTVAGVPSARSAPTSVWTGTEMIVWGGTDAATVDHTGPGIDTGGRYNPETNIWTATSVGTGVPSGRYAHQAIWTGTEMIVWGGAADGTYFNSGGRYNPAGDSWTTTSIAAGVPSARYSHQAVWTGTEMIVWGGYFGAVLSSGGRYNPTTDSWTATSTAAGVPSARNLHTLVWTGTDMIVWGGFAPEFTNSGGRYIIDYHPPCGGVSPGTPFIAGVAPDRGGNNGDVTVTISGCDLDPNAAVVLSGPGHGSITATRVSGVSAHNRLVATFDLRGAAVGTRNLIVTNPDTLSATLSNAFTVEAPTQGGFRAQVQGGSGVRRVRQFRNYTAIIEYANDGNIDIPAPLLIVTATSNAALRVSPLEPYSSDPMQILALGAEGSIDTIPPGAKYSIPVHFRSSETTAGSTFNLVVKEMPADDEPIDWAEMELQLRPNDVADDAWNAIWTNVKNQVGLTRADFRNAMMADAVYLGSHGRRTYSVRDLFNFEMMRAKGLVGPKKILESATDLAIGATGLPLVFARSYPVALEERFRSGPLGRGWTHAYEISLARPTPQEVEVRGPGKRRRQFVASRTNWVANVGDPGVLTRRADLGWLLTEKNGRRAGFSSAGVLEYMEDSNANRLTFTYDIDKLIRVEHTNGYHIDLTYSTDGRISGLVDHSGRQVHYTYDAAGEHLISATRFGNRVTQYEYAAPSGGPTDHSILTITYPDAIQKHYEYDLRGRVTAEFIGENVVRFDYAYFDPGEVRITNGSGGTYVFRAGFNGDVLEFTDTSGNSARFSYGQDHAVADASQPDGATTHYQYDSKSNVRQVVNALGNSVLFGWTPNLSRLDWMRDARGNVTDFETDMRGNTTSITYAESSLLPRTATYDATGKVTSTTNRRNETITFDYDVEGRLIQKTYPNSRTVTYTYDGRGNLLTAADTESGTVSMQYDDRDFMTRVDYPGGKWFEFVVDDGSKRTQRSGDDGYVLNYQYDGAGRLSGVTDVASVVIASYEYDDASRLARESKGNGTYTNYEYDTDNRILSIVHHAPDGTEQARFDYSYDANGRRTSAATSAGTIVYAYDTTGQLTGVSYPGGREVVYAYDPAGNRVSVIDAGVTTDYTTSNMNQYLEVGATTYDYDDDGNMITKIDAAGITSYSYDAENRLVSLVVPSGEIFEFRYDALGNRTSVSSNGTMTSFVHDPVGLVEVAAEHAGDGSLLARYIHGVGLVAREDPLGSRGYYGSDAIGSACLVTDAAGQAANAYSYEPFGRLLSSQESIANRYRFVGLAGVRDDGAGLDFMRARMYDAETGRFVSEDPIGIVGGVNLYTYVSNNPVRFTDPSGLFVGQLYGTLVGRLGISALWGQTAYEAVLGGKIADALIGPALSALGPDVLPSNIEGTLNIASGIQGISLGYHIGVASSAAAGAVALPAAIAAASGVGIGTGLNQLFDLDTRLADAAFELFHGDPAEQCAGGCPELNRAIYTEGASVDPNEKVGPSGFGSQRFVTDAGDIEYTIFFENQPSAEFPAQEVTITDDIDPDLDYSTIVLGEVAFGNQLVDDLRGQASGTVTVPLNGSNDVVVITVANVGDGHIEWRLKAVDPLTGDFPADDNVGVLPQNDENGRGEGHVTFTIRPVGAPITGTEITNSASIVFDINAPIITNTWRNTLDTGAPSSTVTSVIPKPNGTPAQYFVQWAGTDDVGGSGVRDYTVYVAVDNGPFTPWLVNTSASSAVFVVECGHTYSFASAARDNVGNVETPPSSADQTLPMSADSDADSMCDCCDNCPTMPNAKQADGDADGVGDVCDVNPMYRVSNNPSDNPDYSTIQDAVNAAPQSGTRIEILSGVYHESVVVDSAMTFEFLNASNGEVVVDGGSGPAFDVRSTTGTTPVTFRNLTLRGQTGIRSVVSTRIEEVRFEAIQEVALDLQSGSHEIHGVQFVNGVANGIRLASAAAMNLSLGRFEAVAGVALQTQGVAETRDVLMVQGGTAIAVSDGSLDLHFATIADNSGRGIERTGPGAVSVTSSIVYGNLGGDLAGIACGVVAFSDIGSPGCAGLGGNLSADPAFSTGYHLSATSPCLDSGPNPASYDRESTTDLDGDLRLRDFDGDGYARSDAGAFEAVNETLAPGEVQDVGWVSKSVIEWSAVPGATSYHVYRGSINGRSYASFGTCEDLTIAIVGTSATESAVPPTGDGYYYLFTAEDAGGNQGTLGYGTEVERSNFNPCQ